MYVCANLCCLGSVQCLRRVQPRTQLGAMGLPGSVEAAETSTGLPESVWARINLVQSKVRIAQLFCAAWDNAGM